MDRVRSGDQFQLTASFFDQNGSPVIPLTAKYVVSLAKGGAVLRAATAIPGTLATAMSFWINQADTAMQDTTKREEEHVVTVIATYGTDTDGNPEQKSEEYHFEVVWTPQAPN